jgi:hypothetical protein
MRSGAFPIIVSVETYCGLTYLVAALQFCGLFENVVSAILRSAWS